MVGGARHEPGDASPVAEFHFWCDPAAARQVLRCGAPVTLVPLDVTRKLILSPADIRALPGENTRAGEFLRKLVPLALAPTANLYGVEGVYLADVVALVTLLKPGVMTTKSVAADVEMQGELTRGMSVFDTRWGTSSKPNIELVVGMEVPLARHYINQVLSESRE
jgi:inosine-uridine nucleoside N-ribohydrolase